ncbi:MAG: sigma-70 family RNA polymerase sigma factor [Clostridia bacterium]|nr:sigma-70 family RNA polymerase sigma factor [Clostridia bacterium]
MQDNEILDLYFARDERAIIETDKKHGDACMQVSMNILSSKPDAEECVNDTYLRAWNTIPPERPSAFRTFLCRITRNLSIDRFRYLHRQKRDRDLEITFSELENCISMPEEEADALVPLLSDFLRREEKIDRLLFVGKYFHACPVKLLARKSGLSENLVSVRLFRTRERFRRYLEEKGYKI